MNKELEIWRFTAERLNQNKSVMLLVVAESSGSSPGRLGFKMAIGADDLTGSIGGGAMEIRLVGQAKLKIQNKELKIDAQVVEQNHRRNAANASGMICSGRQTVIFYKLNPTDLPTIERLVRSLENDQPKTLQISTNSFCVSDNQTSDFKFERRSANDFLYEERLGSKNKLFIVGGGHCALALSELMSKMDFHISLFDDRADLNTLEKNRFVHRKQIIESYENIGDFVDSGANVFVVVMTVGYKSDETVIRKLIGKNFKYFGVLGSEAKIKTLFRKLEQDGFDKEKLNKICAPVGLKINSRTPEEIAVSVAAEIIRVKNAGD